eukprot:TRINITY_DN14170_c0_g1_i1.p1 TRINITY_DN14170_c0_g1~~TRINITY_DN14170_c0_g1_i1.p1  ORF type:complete len:535 (-),score=111.37 TRINITY_DN14170_c0_g1_i1:665-2119(-)
MEKELALRRASIVIDMLHADPLVLNSLVAGDEVVPVAHLNIGDEQNCIRRSRDETGAKALISFAHLTSESFGLSLSRSPDILHVSTHGILISPSDVAETPQLLERSQEYVLAFESRTSPGEVDLFSVNQVRKMLAPFGKKRSLPKIVVLNACYSERVADAFVQAGCPHVIACTGDSSKPVLDSAARYFTRHFYFALFCGHSVLDSFQIAVTNVEADFDLKHRRNETMRSSQSFVPPPMRGSESLKFLLLPENSGHSEVFFPSDSSFELLGPKISSKLPPVVSHFVGRNEETHRIVSGVLRGRFLHVGGELGIGKTSIASNAVHYVNQRNLFTHGVFYINCSELRDFLHDEGELIRIFQKCFNISVEIETVDQIWEHVSNWDCLVFADGCDPILCEFLVHEFVGSTLRPRVVMTSRMDSSFVRSIAIAAGILPSCVEISSLNREDAIRLVLHIRPGIALEHAQVVVSLCGGSPSRIIRALSQGHC